MDAQTEQLFAPGTAATPPALTGRGEEQAVLSRCLAALAGGKAPAHDVVLVGPRGNGKTVLLNWFARECRSSKRVDAVTLTPADVGDRQALIEVHGQCYPYFVQLWGDALWKQHLANGVDRLGDAEVAAAMPQVAAEVTNYYQARYAELEAAGLVTAGAAVAPLFQGSPNEGASNQAIDEALAAAGIDAEEERYQAREALNDLGYIWRPPNQLPPVVWRAGIPSLMTHVLAHAPTKHTTERETL